MIRLMEYVFDSLKVPDQLHNYALRCESAPLGRPAPSRLISVFSKHPLVKWSQRCLVMHRSLNFLEEKAIKDPIQKETFFNQLNSSLAKFPSVVVLLCLNLR